MSKKHNQAPPVTQEEVNKMNLPTTPIEQPRPQLPAPTEQPAASANGNAPASRRTRQSTENAMVNKLLAPAKQLRKRASECVKQAEKYEAAAKQLQGAMGELPEEPGTDAS